MITDRITTELSTGYGTVNVKLSKSFEFLEGGSDIIDCDLALTALILSSYVYNGNKAVDLLNRLGFDYTDMPIGEKSQAFHPLSAMGYKKLVTSSGQSKNLFVIAVKGTDPEHTWIEDIICSDIIDGAVSMFDICRSRVVDDFKAFAVSATGKDIDTLKNEENYIVLTGHSLGGATANCLSVDQTMMELTNNKKDRIFTYTFEPPHTCINLWWMNPEKMSCAFNFKDRDDFITNVPPYSGSTTYGKDISFDVKELDDDIFLKLFPDANGGSVLEAPKLENYGDLWGHHDIGLDLTYIIQHGIEHNWWNDLSDVVPSGSEAKMTQVILSEERVNTDEDWKKGYMDILRGVKPDGEWEKDAYSYQIYDIDENGVPEFWIRPPYEDTSFTIYTFCDGNVIPTGETHNWHLSVCPLTGENGIILRCGQDMVEQVRIAQLIDGKLEENEAYDLSVENWTEYETLKKYRLNDTSGIINWSHNLPDSNRERLNQIMKSNENPEPFYGIWCGASKQYSDMEKKADELISKGFNAKICETTDWSNLNDEWWVVVSAGVYDTEEGAQADLDNVKSFYPDAYIKYSGDYKAGLNKNSDT